jgi:2-oxoglutarate ferredoxin oxidoreductase subunit gamma
MIIRFAGFGGQGIVLLSYILGKAAIEEGKSALQTQSYGSESRGGECKGDVILSEETIYELEPQAYDVLVALAQPAYDKFIPHLKKGGVLIIDQDLVVLRDNKNPQEVKIYKISAQHIASQKFKRAIVANMIILGYLNTLLNLVDQRTLEETIKKTVPKDTVEMNLSALKEGIILAKSHNKVV